MALSWLNSFLLSLISEIAVIDVWNDKIPVARNWHVKNASHDANEEMRKQTHH